MKLVDFDATIHIRGYNIEVEDGETVDDAIKFALDTGDYEILGTSVNSSNETEEE